MSPINRAGLGQIAGRVFPGLDDRIFNRDRDRSLPTSRAPRRGYPKRDFDERPMRILVVPTEGPQFSSWRPGTRNFYYEVWQSAREKFGESQVFVLDIAPSTPSSVWQHALIDQVQDLAITHIVTHIEHDPGSPNHWTWDEAWNQLAPAWDGALLGVMFDSAYDLVTMKSRRLARMSAQFLAVDICVPIDGVLVRGRPEVGPVTMPVSKQSLDLVNAKLANQQITHDVSFIGALYPYRVQLIEQLRALGVDVAVNPHRSDETSDFATSRTNQPEWLDYMAGLAQSRMTINFSRSSAGDFEQLKTRVIEATLAGTFLLTDDRESTKRFFTPDLEYGYFESVEQLPAVVQHWLANPDLTAAGRQRAQHKAQEIALNDFWNGVSGGLERRGLPLLPRA